MMEQRIKYDNSLRGKLLPYSPVDRLNREILIAKIMYFFFLSVTIVSLIVLLIIEISLITME